MRLMCGVALAVAAVGLACGCSSWRDGDSDTDKGSGSASVAGSADTAFIRDAGMSGKMEVEAGRMGVSKASNPEVRAFAQRLVADHSEANAELGRLASARGVTLPAMTTDAKSRLDSLSGAAGTDFDRRFMAMMVDDHTQAVSKFEAQAKNGKDAAVRDFASRTLPTLREHLRIAGEISSRLGR